VFHGLKREQIRQIVDIQLESLRGRLAERGLGIRLSDAARNRLAEEGFDPVFGARPLKRAIQRLVENALARELLAGRFVAGDTVTVEVRDGDLAFEKTAVAQAQPA